MQHCLGMVIEANPGINGLVWKVMLKYKLPNGKVDRFVDHSIHGIAVILPIEEQNDNVDNVEFKESCVKYLLNPKSKEFYHTKSIE